MKYIKIQGNLLDVLGEDARLTENETGIKLLPQYQFLEGETSISIGTIINEQKALKYFNLENVTVLTKEQANQEIDKNFIPQYTIYNEGLMSANLNQKITKGKIDLDEMQPDWTQQQETEWLYKQGVSGIKVNQKPKYFTE